MKIYPVARIQQEVPTSALHTARPPFLTSANATLWAQCSCAGSRGEGGGAWWMWQPRPAETSSHTYTLTQPENQRLLIRGPWLGRQSPEGLTSALPDPRDPPSTLPHLLPTLPRRLLPSPTSPSFCPSMSSPSFRSHAPHQVELPTVRCTRPCVLCFVNVEQIIMFHRRGRRLYGCLETSIVLLLNVQQ